MVATVYKSYSDAAHGWVAVKRSEIERLGLSGRISRYSYQRGDTCYIEEDGDLVAFLTAKRERNELVSFKQGKRQNRSPIRSYESYKSNT